MFQRTEEKLYSILVFIKILSTVLSAYDSAHLSSVSELIDGLSNQDSATLRPLQNSNNTLDVNISWNLVSIIDFDEANGYIEISGYLTLEWQPEAYNDFFSSGYTGIENLANTQVWKPPIILVNSLKFYDVVGDSSHIRIQYDFLTKTCTWKPWIISKVACSPNVQYYPFDQQSCILKFSVWGYTNEEVTLNPKSSEWTFSFFEENGEWQISNSTVESSTLDYTSMVDFKVDLTRRPLYYIINLLAPVVLLGVLNSCTFLLPTASGERIGFTVTCFLSYIVLLNTIMMYLPTSSTPFSNLSYYTFIMMLFSAGVSLMTIITVRIHHKDDTGSVPRWLAAVFICCCCKGKERRQAKVAPKSADLTVTDWDEDYVATESTTTEVSEDKDVNVTWSEVASFIDTVMFLGFLGGQIFFSIGYLLPMFLATDWT